MSSQDYWDIVDKLKPYGWEHFDGCTIVHRGRIVAEDVVYRGKIYRLPDALIGKFFIEDVFIHAHERKGKGWIIEYASGGSGFHPHIADFRITDELPVCVGDLISSPLEKAANVPEMLKHIKAGNACNSDAVYLTRILFDNALMPAFENKELERRMTEYLLRRHPDFAPYRGTIKVSKSDGQVFKVKRK